MAKFRLATLLKLRERERDAAAKDVSDARLAIDRVESAKQETLDQNEAMNVVRKSATQGTFDLRQVLDAQRFQMILAAQLEQLNDQLGKLNQELERRQAILLRYQIAVKSLEKLRDQRNHSAEQSALAKQQERLDEWSSVRFASRIQEPS
jgi:flagellar protein FliJ